MGENYDFMDLLNDEIGEVIDTTPFSINNIKLTHFYFNDGDYDVGSPIKTSLELSCDYNFETQRLIWTKTVSHTYYNLTGGKEHETDSNSSELSDCDELIKSLNNIDLRQLSNNYFTNKSPEKYSHWELSYNNYFNITGTYDKEIEEVKRISYLTCFKEVIKDECKKITDKIQMNC